MKYYILTLILLTSCGLGGEEKKGKEDLLIKEISINRNEFLNELEFDFSYAYTRNKEVTCIKAPFIKDNKINTCYKYVNKLDRAEILHFLSLFFDEAAYPGLELSCSQSEYGFAFIRNNVLVGWLLVDLDCEKVWASPKIKEQFEVSESIGYSITSYSTEKKENICNALNSLGFNADCKFFKEGSR